MSFRLERGESVEDGLKRIVLEEVDKAIAEIADEKLPRDEATHQVRKRCKKVRGAVRLVRRVFGAQYRVENAAFRECARELSVLRDAQVMVATFDAVLHQYRRQIDRRRFAPLRQQFVRQRQELTQDRAGQQERLARARGQLHEARGRIAAWKLEACGFETIEAGLRKTYADGRKALRRAYQTSRPEDFHEWRKRVKYHRYHLRLLRNLWPCVMRAWRRDVVTLSEFLGNEHDLAVFRARLGDWNEGLGRGRELQDLLCLVGRRRDELRTQARPLGERIFAEKPRQFDRRLRKYWQVWRAEDE